MPQFYNERKVARSMREQKMLDWPLEIKSLDESGHFSGYASVFDVVDNQRDVVLPGAFSRSLRERDGEVKLLWQHKMDEPIGVITTLREDAVGLYIEGYLLIERVARAKEAFHLLQQGVVKGLSIGYSPVRYRFDPDNGIRQLQEVELWEVSFVTFPANEAAYVAPIKHQGASATERHLSVALDHALSALQAH